jgi:truncated hemoglobin YjbI
MVVVRNLPTLFLPDITPVLFDQWLDRFQATCREVLPLNEASAFGDRTTLSSRSLQMDLFERLRTRKAPFQAPGPPVD